MSYKAFPLYEFQEEDITRFEDQTAVLLAWEMGTGKSPAGMERDRRIRLANNVGGKTLLIAPLGTHKKWAEWFQTNTPLTVARINPKSRYDLLRTPAHVYIVHWEALALLPGLRNVKWQHVIADEAHKAKSKDAKQTKALKKIPTVYKTALTGTPATNRPQDLWSILNWMYPKIWTSYNRFLDEFVEYVEKENHATGRKYKQFEGPKNVGELLRRIRPYYSRHLKKEQCCPHHPDGVMPWLPAKTYDDIEVELEPKQRRAYNDMLEDMLAWVGEHEGEPCAAPAVISQLQRLQQLALGYLEPYEANVRNKETGEMETVIKYKIVEPSSKVTAVMDLLANNPDEQFLIYSQWKQPLHLLGERLAKAGIPHGFYTGDENDRQREANKSAFISGVHRVLLGSIGAGGTGVDGLQTACKTVVFLDRTWSPADNEQAEDRLHRDGQKDVVQVIDIVARDTVDLGRRQRLDLKWSWIKELLGDGARASR